MVARSRWIACAFALLVVVAWPVFAQAAEARGGELLVLDTAHFTLAQRITAASLQGIANSQEDGPRVFVVMTPGDFPWLNYSLRLAPRTVRKVTFDELLAAVKPLCAGEILYDPAKPFTLDIATSAAGPRRAVITATDLGLPVVLDLRTRWSSAQEAYDWAISKLMPECSHTRAALLPPDAASFRDYAIQQKMFVLSPPDDGSDPTLDDFLTHLEPGASVFGDVTPSVANALTAKSVVLVRGHWAGNLSYYSGIEAGARFYQYPGQLEPVADRYITFIFDCSDLDFALYQMPALWNDAARGSVRLGWALPAALASAAPPVLHRYYADAYRSGTDQFTLGTSGAGDIDIARAPSPDGFYQATARAADALSAHTALVAAPADPSQFRDVVMRLAADGKMRGVFLVTNYDQPVALYNGVPALVTPRVDSVAQAVQYLNRVPLDRRFIALCLNPRTMTPSDAAHLAAAISNRYVVVPPAELMELVRAVGLSAQAGTPAVRVTGVSYPKTAPADTPIPVTAEIDSPDNLYTASVVYRPAGSRFAFAEPLWPSGDNYATELPPLLWGGKMELSVRAVDTAGRVFWSPVWTIDVERKDTDHDGLTDAEEAFLLTDPKHPDTDGDGLLDGNDPAPLVPNRAPAWYFGPLFPPADAVYLSDGQSTQAEAHARVVPPGKSVTYALPAGRVPPRATAVVNVTAHGAAAIATSAGGGPFSDQYSGDLSGDWYSPALSPGGQLSVRITCPASAKEPLRLTAIGLTSPPNAPSVLGAVQSPAHPGPAQPITVSAVAFSPRGVAGASLTCRVNGQGTATIPMVQTGQRYTATIPALDNRDVLDYWITARTAQGDQITTPPTVVPIGGRGREVVSLMARREFAGGWRPAPDWDGAASAAPGPGASDTAPANLTGGIYSVWVLAGGRGNDIVVSVDGRRVGAVDGSRPDGWQEVGRAALDAGKHQVTVTAEAKTSGAWSAPRYAEVILSDDSTFEPPAGEPLDIYNSLVLLSPDTKKPLSGTVHLLATGAGNVQGAQFSVDGQLLRRVSGPPFACSLSTDRFQPGQHTLRIETVDRTGPTGLALEVPITIVNQ